MKPKLLLWFLLCCFSCNKKADVNPIAQKCVLTDEITYNETKSLYYKSKLEYDKELISKRIVFTNNGQKVWEDRYEYDAKTQKINKITTYDNNDNLTSSQLYEYDAASRKIKYSSTISGQYIEHNYEYDLNSNLSKQTILFKVDIPKVSQFSTYIFQNEYDSFNRLTKVIENIESLNQISKIITIYQTENTFFYNNQGRLVKKIQNQSLPKKSTAIINYDYGLINGKLLKEYSNELRYDNTYYYDNNENLVKSIRKNNEFNLTYITEYQYICQ